MATSLQRERARADQFYVRSRNLLAFGTALFTAVQAAFVSNLGRANAAGQALITAAERRDVASIAGIGLGLLVLAVGILFLYADRARDMNAVTAAQAYAAYADDPAHQDASVLDALAAKLEDEDNEWARTNSNRRFGSNLLAIVVCAATLATLFELTLVYSALS